MTQTQVPIFPIATNHFIAAHHVSDVCSVDIHLHDACEVYMALTSDIRYYIEGTYYDMHPGDIIITREKEIHRPTMTHHHDYNRMYLMFQPEHFKPSLPQHLSLFDIFHQRQKGRQNLIRSNHPLHPHAKLLFERIVQLNHTSTVKERFEQQLLVMELFLALDTIHKDQYEDASSSETITPIDERIDRILEDISQHFNEPYDLNSLASRHYMDRYYMCHLFKTHTGFSIMEYIQSKRISYAKELLINKTLTMSDISQRVGYEDYSNFYKTFRKLTGVSPKKYQQDI